MRSQKNRIRTLEAVSHIECESLTIPNNLKELYELEHNPDSKMGKSFRELYNENRATINPNDSIK
jgi:transcription initiation factor TFIIIB Brf1 subunit/transcription initiation factor TFIIB